VRLSLVHLASAIVVAAFGAASLHQRSYRDFERARVNLGEGNFPAIGSSVEIELPSLASLHGTPCLLLLDLRNDAPSSRTIAVFLDDRELATLTIQPASASRLNTLVPADVALGTLQRLTLRGDGDLWLLRRAQLTNFYGFSSGLFSAVVAPESTREYTRPSASFTLGVLTLLLALGLLDAPPRIRRETIAFVLTAAASAALATAWLAPIVSPYRILFAPHTALVLIAMLYAPLAKRHVDPLVQRVANVARVVIAASRATLSARRVEPVGRVLDGDLVATYCALLIVLMLMSVPRQTGDGQEYLAMAADFARLEWPPAEESRHFWLYPLLAAPLSAITEFLHFGPEPGFALFNLLLLASAFAVVVREFGRAAALLTFVAPILWWIDKVHTEVFMFSLLAVAVATLRDRPWWALMALGGAAAQNPAIGPLIPAAVAVTIAFGPRWRDRRFQIACLGSAALTLSHPAYFMSSIGRPVPLLDAGRPIWPTLSELGAVIADLNIGLVPNFPALMPCVGIALGSRGSRWRPGGNEIFAAFAAAVLSFGFAQTTNFNHGGTIGLSRYGLWLIPLAMPALRYTSEARPAFKRAIHGLVAVSALASVVWFHPAWREQSTSPSWIASAVWSRLPDWTRPLPEIFVERLQGAEFPWWLPVATGDCSKALLKGQGDAATMWPASCSPVPVPAGCVRPGALCYANRSAATIYTFDRVTARPDAGRYRLRRENVWSESVDRTAARLGERLNTWESGDLDLPEEPLTLRREPIDSSIQVTSRAIGGLRWFAGGDWIAASLSEIGPDAVVWLRIPEPVVGKLVDALSGKFIDSLDHAEPGTVFAIPLSASTEPRALILKMIL
jgi:hypothetical protein